MDRFWMYELIKLIDWICVCMNELLSVWIDGKVEDECMDCWLDVIQRLWSAGYQQDHQ